MKTIQKRSSEIDIQKLDKDIMQLDLNEIEWELLEDPDPLSEEARAELIQKNYQDIHPSILKRLAIGESEVICHAAQVALNELKLTDDWMCIDNCEIDQDPMEMDEGMEMSV